MLVGVAPAKLTSVADDSVAQWCTTIDVGAKRDLA